MGAIAAAVGLLASAPTASAYIIWTDPGSGLQGGGKTISQANLDGASPKPLTAGAGSPFGVVEVGNHVYWTNVDTNSIGRMNLDGSGFDANFIHPAVTGGTPLGLASDGTYLYWSDANQNVGRAALNGTNVNLTCLPIGKSTSPAGLAISGGTIYVGVTNAIDYTALGCSASPVIHQLVPLVSTSYPSLGMTVFNNTLYFTAYPVGGGTIDSLLLNSPGAVPTAVITGLNFPTGVAVQGGYLYWADHLAGSIGRAPLASPNLAVYSFITSGTPYGLIVDPRIDPTTTTVSCSPGSVAAGGTTVCRAIVGDSASPSVPAGTVIFSGDATTPFLGGASSCTLTPDAGGGASCVVGVVPQAAETSTVKAAYQGDGVHQASNGKVDICVGAQTACGTTTMTATTTTTTTTTSQTTTTTTTTTSTGSEAPSCVVPRLVGQSLSKARRALTAAGCTIGRVRSPRTHRHHKLPPLIVVSQSPRAGSHLRHGGRVAVKLGRAPKHHRRARRR